VGISETVYAPLANGRVIKATIRDNNFYDPQGEKPNV